MSFNPDNLLGFGAVAIGSIATVEMTKSIAQSMRGISNPPRRRSPPRKMKKGRKKK